MEFDPEREITVCCGATEGMIASLLAVVDPGDEIVLFEPFYENYGPDTQLCGATSRYVTLRAPDWTFDPDELRAAFNSRTKAIILNSPNNPTGKVFSRAELECIAGLCQEFDCLAITDEIYEHILYDGTVHVPILSLPGMRDRSILVNSMSKTYSVTGWRVGWVLAAPDLTDVDPQGSRFPDRGSSRSITAGRGGGALPAGRLLQSSFNRVCRAARPHRDQFGNCRIQVFYPAWRILRDDRHL